MVKFKDIIKILLLVSLFIYSQSIVAQLKVGSKRIVLIDPGHGGIDSGAVGLNSVLEKDIVLKIATEMVKISNGFLNNGLDLYLTRYKDTLISLRDRTKLSKQLKADLFISLHCNYSENLNAKGTEVFVYKKENDNSIKAITMGLNIQENLNDLLGFKSRVIKTADFQVLQENSLNCPTLLLELGFLSNTDEANYLNREENITALAWAIISGINLNNE